MRNLLKNKIYNGDLKEAVELAHNIELSELETLLMEWGFEEPTMLLYTFLLRLLEKEESAELHSLIADILCHPLCHLDGAYAVAFYHAKECVRLAPENISYKEFLLFFHEIPDKLLDKETAIQIAREILQEEIHSQVARGFIERDY